MLSIRQALARAWKGFGYHAGAPRWRWAPRPAAVREGSPSPAWCPRVVLPFPVLPAQPSPSWRQPRRAGASSAEQAWPRETPICSRGNAAASLALPPMSLLHPSPCLPQHACPRLRRRPGSSAGCREPSLAVGTGTGPPAPAAPGGLPLGLSSAHGSDGLALCSPGTQPGAAVELMRPAASPSEASVC